MGLCDLAFCVTIFATGKYGLGLDTVTLRTLTVVILVFSGQAVFYVVRERRRLWSSRPGKWLLVSSAVDLTLFSLLAVNGVLMAPLPIAVVASVFAAAIAFALILDTVKLFLLRRFQVA